MQIVAVNQRGKLSADTLRGYYDVTPTVDELMVGAGRPLTPEEDNEEEQDSEPQEIVMVASTVQPSNQYAQLAFADSRPAPAPPSEMFDVPYAEVNKM